MMGMFDYIKFETVCPNCDGEIKDFQSKDSGCFMTHLEFWEVDNFYASCDKCHTWVEYKIYNKPNRKLIIEDYDIIVTTPGNISKEFNKENDEMIKELFAKSEEAE